MNAVTAAWTKIVPYWPLKHLVATNPLAAFESETLFEALAGAKRHFQRGQLPPDLEAVNRETIKWLLPFFDQGQAPIGLPYKEKGLYKAFRTLAVHDGNLPGREWIATLPDDPQKGIEQCVARLGLSEQQLEPFFTALLTTLPGWASYIQYLSSSELRNEYLALRLVLVCLLAPDLRFHEVQIDEEELRACVDKIEAQESTYRTALNEKLLSAKSSSSSGKAQWVFCIDVRSEPFRRALEAQGGHETFGFAGFFALPISVEKSCGEAQASCPVLIEPMHTVKMKGKSTPLSLFKRLYHDLKYRLTTPFALVDLIGGLSGVAMVVRTFFPKWAHRLSPRRREEVDLNTLPFEVQATAAYTALKTMGLTKNFAPLVVFCGHGSHTTNNPFASGLDCGACAGRPGGVNAQMLAHIMNQPPVRAALAEKGIEIPQATTFIAAEHNTTTDEVTLFTEAELPEIRADLDGARKQLGTTSTRAYDWAQTRPEWGLARNAAFIVGPRALTQNIDLEGRSFLHSYDYTQDDDLSALTTILTAPMIVAQWINAHYFFSTLDPVTFGAGSKVTKNVTGKIGVMQGNASDLMNGLPLQSVYTSDDQPYHELQRLYTVVYAPKKCVEKVISEQPKVRELCENGWVTIACFDPETNLITIL